MGGNAIKRRFNFWVLLLVPFGLLLPGIGQALDFPAKPIEMVVGAN